MKEEITLEKNKRYWKARYDGIIFNYKKTKEGYDIEIKTKKGKFSKGYRYKKKDGVELLQKGIDALEKSLEYTAMFWFMKEY